MDWSTITSQLVTILLPILATTLTAVFSWLGVKIKTILQEQANTDAKQKIINSTVKYVEQVYKDVHGEDKLNKAVTTASEWLNQKGITITDAELHILIEAAVNSLEKAEVEIPEKTENK